MNNVIIFPTDTVYGMGVSVYDVEGQREIYRIKGRPANKRLSVLCASLEDIEKIAIVSEDARKLIEKYMPGNLTIILKAKEEIISEYIYDTVAVRIPKHPLALRILRGNGPMATTSVNVSGEAPMNNYYEIVEKFSNEVFYIYPNAEEISGVSSTIVDLTVEPYKLIREGDLKYSELLHFLNK